MPNNPKLARVVILQTAGPAYTAWNNLPWGVAQQKKKELVAKGYDPAKIKVTYAN